MLPVTLKSSQLDDIFLNLKFESFTINIKMAAITRKNKLINIFKYFLFLFSLYSPSKKLSISIENSSLIFLIIDIF